MNKVSIIIPVYNGSNYLRDSISSCLNQTYKNVEIIVVNDGSRDDGRTDEIAKSFGDHILYISKSNGGVASALNYGIRASTGDWIAWLSHDDIFIPTKIEKQLSLLQHHPTCGVCYSNYYVIDNMGHYKGELEVPNFPARSFFRHLFQCMFVCGSTTLVRRDLFSSAGYFDEGLKYAQDADMWMRLAQITHFIHCPEALIGWRFHAEQGSNNAKMMALDRSTYLQNCISRTEPRHFFPDIDLSTNANEKLAHIYSYLASIMLRCHREPTMALRLFWKSALVWPNIRNRANYHLVLHIILGWVYYKIGRSLAALGRRTFPKRSPIPNVDFVRASTSVKTPDILRV